MWKLICICLLSCFIFALHAITDHDYSDNTVLVVLKPEISQPDKSQPPTFFGVIDKNVTIENISLINNQKAIDAIHKRGSQYKAIYKITLPTYDKALIHQTIDTLKQNPQIEYVTPDYYLTTDTVPNDPEYTTQWALNGTHGIQAEQAWDIATGSQNIRVGVIDSGIATHPDLDNNVTEGFDFYYWNPLTTDDEIGHGTHVAGIIGAVGNNEIGIAGVNWNVTIVPLQVAISGASTSMSAIVSAISYAANTWGTDEQISVLNHSIGGYGDFKTDPRLIAIENYPGLFIWSAGNGMMGGGGTVDLPENAPFWVNYNLPNIIAVGATQSDGQRSWFSNYSHSGAFVHVYAPGTDIYSTMLDNGYALDSGTSMAAPHVTGLAALLLSVNPTLTTTQLKQLIVNGGDDITISLQSGQQVVKKLNATKAVQLASGQSSCLAVSPISHNFGTVYNYHPSTQTFTVSSFGNDTFTIDSITLTQGWYESFSLNVTGLPWTINPGDTESFSVTFTPLSTQIHTASINIFSNAENTPLKAIITGLGWPTNNNFPYTENFDTDIPIDWSTSTLSAYSGVKVGSGVNGTKGFVLNVRNSTPAQETRSHMILGITDLTKLSFAYRIVDFTTNWSGDLTATTLSEGDKVYIEVAQMYGSYQPVYEINYATHTPSTAFAALEIPLESFNMSNIYIQIRAEWATGNWSFVFDDVAVKADEVLQPPVNLTATAGEDFVFLTWQAPLNGFPPWYIVYRNGVNISGILYCYNPTTYQDNTVVDGNEYTYYVTARYAGIEVPSEPVTVQVGSADFDAVTVPVFTALVGNYPNPFNPETVISFSIGSSERVVIDIYNVRGQRVRSLVSGVYGTGVHSIVWNGCADDGRSVGSGVYFYRMSAGEYSGVRKMLMLK